VKGHRPTVGTWDNKDQVYCVAALNVVTGQLTTRLLEQPARSTAKTGQSKQQRLQVAFAAHLRDIARAYPASQYPEVVITLENAPWHRGVLMEHVLVAHPHLRLKRLPSYSPQLNVIERFWRVLRHRATHNRLFASMARLRTTLRQGAFGDSYVPQVVVYPHVTDNSAVAQYGKIVLFHHHGRGHHHGTEPVVLPTPPGRSRVDFPHDPYLVARPFQGHTSQAPQARQAPA
jgi:transposase